MVPQLTMKALSRYDVVRVVKVLSEAGKKRSPHDRRPPQPGDTATVLEVYVDPPGYELECCDERGVTIWLGGFTTNDIELERIWNSTDA